MNVKNPVMILNELQPAGLRYDHVVKSGTEHLPVYTVNVNVYGQTFSGVGRTKKEAKQLAAHTALESCIQFQHPSQIHTFQAAHQPRDQALTSASEDFTNDNDEVHRPPQCLERSSTYSFRCGAAECEPARSKLDCRSSSSVWAGMLKDRPPVTQSLDLELHRTRTMCRAWSNPVAVLNDLRPNVQYRRVDSDQVGIRKVGFDNGPDHRGRQRAVVALSAEVDGQEFLGCGRTQKFAKRQLASQVLRTLFKFQYIGQRSPQARYTSPG